MRNAFQAFLRCAAHGYVTAASGCLIALPYFHSQSAHLCLLAPCSVLPRSGSKHDRDLQLRLPSNPAAAQALGAGHARRQQPERSAAAAARSASAEQHLQRRTGCSEVYASREPRQPSRAGDSSCRLDTIAEPVYQSRAAGSGRSAVPRPSWESHWPALLQDALEPWLSPHRACETLSRSPLKKRPLLAMSDQKTFPQVCMHLARQARCKQCVQHLHVRK